MAENYDSTPTDEPVVNSVSEDTLLADILRSSKLVAEATGVNLPIRGEVPSEPVLSDSEYIDDEEDLEHLEYSAAEDDVESENTEGEKVVDTGEDDEESTQPVYTMDDLEDIPVTHKINGEDVTMPLSEWIAGSATKQHLSKQGLELGNARKQVEEERTIKLAQLEQLGTQLAQATHYEEQQLAQQYHEINDKLQKAKREDDDYEIGKLSKQVDKAQRDYWEVRSRREQTENAVKQHLDNARAQAFQQEVDRFYSEIPSLIPDWDEKVAEDIRTFALEEGISEQIVNTMTDPHIVKAFDDYRRLKQGVQKGAVKRKAAPTKKVPLKKPPTKKKKQQEQQDRITAKAFNPNSSAEDQLAFLRQRAEKTLNGL